MVTLSHPLRNQTSCVDNPSDDVTLTITDDDTKPASVTLVLTPSPSAERGREVTVSQHGGPLGDAERNFRPRTRRSRCPSIPPTPAR